MTLRQLLDGVAGAAHDRLDEVLDSEDAAIVLADGRSVTTYLHGFGASGCHLEMLAGQMEAAVRLLGCAGNRDR